MAVPPQHEAMVQLFKDCPEMAPRMLTDLLGVQVPQYDCVSLECADLTETIAVERRADAVVSLRDSSLIARVQRHEQTEMCISVEVQRSFERVKFRRWLEYSAVLGTRMDCPAVVMAVCPESEVARKYDVDFPAGPRIDYHPLVVGPEVVPVVTDPAWVATSPALAVLVATVHAEVPGVIEALCEGLGKIDTDKAKDYTRYTLTLLDGEDRQRMETIANAQTMEYQSEFIQSCVDQGVKQGFLEGEIRMLLRIIERRGTTLSDEQRARIKDCADPEAVERWADRVVAAETADDIFG
ncbi:hypothetical protein HNR23_000102 [Nocardiopsis mwathae]|uniref:Uncharacterized protein n=1 Tax=Nocardiopsis mwathae TaxID=1472723 RepID=A0A7X0D3D3_9ACTN|nr:hypothetical protein [Nocardiopsis mwathae]MBB6170042.1 hypothetical protein [Nocardiopsis mwathae]